MTKTALCHDRILPVGRVAGEVGRRHAELRGDGAADAIGAHNRAARHLLAAVQPQPRT